MSRTEPTYIGDVQSVSGGVVHVVLKEMTSSIALVGGESYRVGQVGAFLRVPLGYTQLYGVCTQVGAAAIPANVQQSPGPEGGQRWLALTLFGEELGGQFERGVSQYPTIGDEVHLVTGRDLDTMYGSLQQEAAVTVGCLSVSSGIPARLDLSRLVSRHSAIVGSSGSGKSNLVARLLESVAAQYPSSRVLLFDPHGEYASAVGDQGYAFRVQPETEGDRQLYVPYWALPFDELKQILWGEFSQSNEAQIRDEVAALRLDAAQFLKPALERSSVTADSPIPFSARRLWANLETRERITYLDSARTKQCDPVVPCDASSLTCPEYPPASSGNAAPFAAAPRGIRKQLDLMKSRLMDPLYGFLLSPGDNLNPDLDGQCESDLDALVASWVGHDRSISVVDLSGSPSDVVAAVVGMMLRVIYDMLFWAGRLGVSGTEQPLLVVLEEAHLFLPEGQATAASRAAWRIAKEGRKYGVGLMVVTQRPKDIDSSVLSQCGTMVALRMTNSADRAKVASTLPDDLGDLAGSLPALRTGEALVTGEALPIPSRIMIDKAARKLKGSDPEVAEMWSRPARPDEKLYTQALANWRAGTVQAMAEVKADGGK